jgi:hypothetical protein
MFILKRHLMIVSPSFLQPDPRCLLQYPEAALRMIMEDLKERLFTLFLPLKKLWTLIANGVSQMVMQWNNSHTIMTILRISVKSTGQ